MMLFGHLLSIHRVVGILLVERRNLDVDWLDRHDVFAVSFYQGLTNRTGKARLFTYTPTFTVKSLKASLVSRPS